MLSKYSDRGLYRVLARERLFKGSAAQMMFAHLQQPPPDSCELVPDLPASVARAIMKAMAKQPDGRFQTAGEFAAALG
jgi:serine/threonine-protein kinase